MQVAFSVGQIKIAGVNTSLHSKEKQKFCHRLLAIHFGQADPMHPLLVEVFLNPVILIFEADAIEFVWPIERCALMKNFLLVHVSGTDGSSGHLVGGLTNRPGIAFTPADAIHGQRLAIWRLTDDNALELGQRPGTVLGLSPEGTLEFHHLANGRKPAEQDCWTIDTKNRLIHQVTGKRVKVSRSDGAPVSLVLGDAADDNQDTPTIQEWAAQIDSCLKPPLPNPAFPPFGDGGPGYNAAYQWIEQQLLGSTSVDLRSKYLQAGNLVANLKSDLLNLTCPTNPSGFTSAEFSTVQTTLEAEMTDVLNVNSLYAISQSFYNAVMGQETAELTTLGTALQEAAQQAPGNPTLVAATFFENILYAVFSLFGTGGGFIANVMATAFNTAVAAGALNGNPKTFNFTALQQQLMNQLEAIQSTMAQQQDTILSYRSTMEAVSNLYRDCTYTNTMQIQAEQAGTWSYLQQILQAVLPNLCQICVIYFTSDTSTNSAPSYAQYAYNNGSAGFIYYVQMQNGADFPEAVASQLFSGPVIQQDPQEFYFGMNGWNWADIQSPSQSFDSGNDMVVSIYNATNKTVRMKVEQIEGALLAPGSTSPCDIHLEPGALGVTIGQYNANAIVGPIGLLTKVKLKDSSSNTIAKIKAHQHLLATGGCWADPPKIDNSNYMVPQPHSLNNASGTPGQVLAVLLPSSS
ncbi:hypothetical protein [Sinorhizobium alkalisoli]|uniref:hypothetical protein n=1 Tax=Sinorhizobium alkalisoli TaxID=1752398 RepID=UPI00124CE68F|nr:hypothetical protein [Sinorhizobium alkalisoli]QFI69575.1 hypothetical protein EKH55_4701 [Sinorhizobium alkalisoli]